MGIKQLLFVALFLLSSLTTISQSYNEAYELFIDGKIEASKEMLSAIEQTGEVIFLQGFLHESTGHINQAMVFYYESLPQLDENLQNVVHSNIAELLRKSNLPNEALAQIRLATDDLEYSYGNIDYYFNLGRINIDLGDYRNAIIEFDRSYKLSVEQEQELRTKLKNEKRTKEIQNLKEKIQSSIEDQGEALNWVGIVLQRDSSYQASIDYFDKISTESSYYARGLHNKAMSLKALGKDPLPLLHKSLELKPDKHKFITLKDIGEITKDLEVLYQALDYIKSNPSPKEYNIYKTILELQLANNISSREILKHQNQYHIYNDAFIQQMEAAQSIYKKYSALNTLAMIETTEMLRKEQVANWWKMPLLYLTLILIFTFIVWRTWRWFSINKEIGVIDRKNNY